MTKKELHICSSCDFHSTFYDLINGESYGDGCVCDCDDFDSGKSTHIQSCSEFQDKPIPCPKWKRQLNPSESLKRNLVEK